MDDAHRVLGCTGSLTVNLVLLLAIAGSVATLPGLRTWPPEPPGYGGHGGYYEWIDLWRPFVDNPERGEEGPRCPRQSDEPGRVYLLDAPLPDAFDTRMESAGPHFACVRLHSSGAVRDVRIPRGDAKLADTIRLRWRFSPDQPGAGGWHRVRLTRRPIYEP